MPNTKTLTLMDQKLQQRLKLTTDGTKLICPCSMDGLGHKNKTLFYAHKDDFEGTYIANNNMFVNHYAPDGNRIRKS